MKQKYAWCVAAILTLAVHAQAATDKEALNASGSFSEQRNRIQSELNDGKTYSEISLENKRKVVELLGRMSDRLERSGGIVEHLNAAEKVEFFNEQNQVNVILTSAAADSRLVCNRERTTGSNRTSTQCMTVAQRNRIRKESREYLQSARPDHSRPRDL